MGLISSESQLQAIPGRVEVLWDSYSILWHLSVFVILLSFLKQDQWWLQVDFCFETCTQEDIPLLPHVQCHQRS